MENHGERQAEPPGKTEPTFTLPGPVHDTSGGATTNGQRPDVAAPVKDEFDRALVHWTRKLAYLNAALVAVTFALVVSAFLQFYVMRGQLGEMKAAREGGDITSNKQLSLMAQQIDEMRAQRLLTITQLSAKIRKAGDGFIVRPVTGVGSGLAGWDVTPKFLNLGQTDAHNVHGWWQIADAKAETDPKQIKCPDPTGPLEDSEPGSVAPGGGFLMGERRLNLDKVIAARNNTINIFLLGHLEYRDVVSETPTHHSDWCVIAFPRDPSRSFFEFHSVIPE
jgi:hypothetical protein